MNLHIIKSRAGIDYQTVGECTTAIHPDIPFAKEKESSKFGEENKQTGRGPKSPWKLEAPINPGAF